MLTSDFDFDLPDDLIAQHPVEPRDQSRLMVLDRRLGSIRHCRFADLPELLAPLDVLVRNSSRVVPARLLGRREATGGAWEGLFLRDLANGTWEVLASTRGKPALGETIDVNGLKLRLEAKDLDGHWTVRPLSTKPTTVLLDEHGQIPLPPYIRKGREQPEDRLRYQTIYADQPGSVAAPTAGLHFTAAIFDRLRRQGNTWVDATLHVGLGTFRPIKVDQIEDHVLHEEWASLSPEAVSVIEERRRLGGKVVAVGTTSVRTLETAARSGELKPFEGSTALYLKPGHEFRAVNAMVTNFHLPRSSLLVLVAAFAGYDLVRRAYAEAIAERYRFYSYGDAMLIL